MKSRRQFLTSLLVAAPVASHTAEAQPPAVPSRGARASDERAQWVKILIRIAEPVPANLAANQLKARMPVEAMSGRARERAPVTHLEALARTVAGLAPWLALREASREEEESRARFVSLARAALSNALDPAAADHLEFAAGAQNLVDAAFLALGISRAPAELCTKLDTRVRERLIRALASTRKFTPGRNNWLLFSAMIEAFLASIGTEWRAAAIDVAIRSHAEWYRGDGAYGDGPEFRWDYYNSYVIQPFLLAVLDLIAPVDGRWNAVRATVLERARRYAEVQERMIAPDGSYPALGRSITYRCGAFHHLAAMTLRRELPPRLRPAQVRSALAAVIQRTLGASETFDANGWLRIGLCGHQPSLGERYISTGSLYLCTAAFLPLGLPPADPFWSAPSMEWTARKLWAGADSPADHALQAKER